MLEIMGLQRPDGNSPPIPAASAIFGRGLVRNTNNCHAAGTSIVSATVVGSGTSFTVKKHTLDVKLDRFSDESACFV